ncbi:MAG: GAF domain-containing protein [Chromatiaceae bacterium]|nr:GAF domain-containing protein [Chromatiaceae bacterium]
MTISPSDIRRCFEGAVPSVIATCAPDGTPNVAYLSQVHYVNERQVSLSFQFFNTTRKNILVNPRATVAVLDPATAAAYRLHLEYLHTETEGPLFESMKAKLAGIASHTGMSKVFRLQGSDLYRVLSVERVHGDTLDGAAPRPSVLPELRICLTTISRCTDLASLFDETLRGLEQHFRIGHSMLLIHEGARQRLYTVATRGYAELGVGSEIGVGEGVIGVAARERTPIRIGYTAPEYLYGRTTRAGFAQSNAGEALETEIPFPGLADSGSQLAIPITLGMQLLGVLYVESPQETRFTYEDEDALVVLAGQLAFAIELLSHATEQHEQAKEPAPAATVKSGGAPVTVRHFAVDHSVFIGDEYLIKGVAGAIVWKLLQDYIDGGRSDFTNRELRLDPALRLPDITDNLEARLILLQRRLAARCPFIAIEKTGRGRFRLNVERPLRLSQVPAH